MQRLRLLLGISVFWLALSMLFDGVNTLVLPNHLLGVADDSAKATILGLITFIGLLAGMFTQPIAGAFSDRWRPRWGRRGTLILGAGVTLATLALFGVSHSVPAVLASFILLQIAASTAQAAQQGLIPDLVPRQARGLASGLKGFMDLGG